ncbi:MAG: hypothetical protein V1789_06380, partial [PVC group bacterium]
VPARPQIEALNQNGDKKIILYPQERLKEFCSENGFTFIDLLPAFKSEKGIYETDYFLEGIWGDTHLSPEGHRRVAEYLWSIIFQGGR